MSPSSTAPSIPTLCDPERDAHQAEARRCRKPPLPFTPGDCGLHRTRRRTGYGERLRLGGTFYTIYLSLALLLLIRQ